MIYLDALIARIARLAAHLQIQTLQPSPLLDSPLDLAEPDTVGTRKSKTAKLPADTPAQEDIPPHLSSSKPPVGVLVRSILARVAEEEEAALSLVSPIRACS